MTSMCILSLTKNEIPLPFADQVLGRFVENGEVDIPFGSRF